MSGALITLDQAQPADPSVIPLQQAQPAPGAGNGVGSFLSTAGINALSGVAATPNLIAQGVDWAGRHTVGDPGLSTMQAPWSNGHSILPDYQTVRQGLFDKTGATEFQPQNAAERYGLAAASVVPAVLGGGLVGGAKALLTGDLPAVIPTLVRTIKAVPAAAGAGAGAELGKEAFPAHPIIASLAGALVGGKAGQLAANAPLAAAAGPAGGTLPVEDAQLAQNFRALGIPLSVSQVSNNPWVKRLAAQGGKLPFAGGEEFQNEQQGALNTATSAQMGGPPGRITDNALHATREHLSNGPNGFNAIAGRTSVPVSNAMLSDLQGVVTNSRLTMADTAWPIVERQAMNIINTGANNGGDIGGRAYLSLTARGGPLDGMMQSGDSSVRHAGSQLRDVLDQHLQQNAAPGDMARLLDLRARWRAMKTIEPVMQRADTPGGPSPSVGDVSPQALLGAVNKSYPIGTPNEPGSPGANLRTLAAGSQRFLKEPNSSGTAENSLALHGLSLLGGDALARGEFGTAATAAASAIATALANRPLQALLRNQWLADRTIRASLNPDGFRFTGPRIGQSLPFSFAPAIGPPQQ